MLARWGCGRRAPRVKQYRRGELFGSTGARALVTTCENLFVSRLLIAIQLSSLKLPFKKALAVVRQLGADAIEIDARGEINAQELGVSGIRHVRKLADDFGLKIAAVEFRTRRGYHVAEELQRRIEATKATMELAYALGATVVTNHVGRIPAEVDTPEWQQLTDVLTDLGRHGQRVGATLCAETGAESGADLRRLVEALPPEALGVTFDPGNLIVNGYSAQESLQQLAPWIRHVHINDGVRDVAQGRGLAVEIGRGDADFPALLATLEERQYRGCLSIERTQTSDPAGEIGRAVRFLQAV